MGQLRKLAAKVKEDIGIKILPPTELYTVNIPNH